jgi:hypothetical protein
LERAVLLIADGVRITLEQVADIGHCFSGPLTPARPTTSSAEWWLPPRYPAVAVPQLGRRRLGAPGGRPPGTPGPSSSGGAYWLRCRPPLQLPRCCAESEGHGLVVRRHLFKWGMKYQGNVTSSVVAERPLANGYSSPTISVNSQARRGGDATRFARGQGR